MQTSMYSNVKFVARVNHMKPFQSGIKALSFGKNGSVQLTEEGFQIYVESGKSIQASLSITASFFEEYYLENPLVFGLNMNVFTDCLAIYSGIDCSMKMYYKGHGEPLILVMRPFNEDDIATECQLKTTNYEEPIDFVIDPHGPTVNVIFVNGPNLANIFNDLDKTAEKYEIILSPDPPYFKINIIGVMQTESSIEVAKWSPMILMFKCQGTTTAQYKSSQIRLMSKAFSAAMKTAIKTDASGLLEMQFMLKTNEQSEVYLQFFVTPLVDTD